MCMLPAERENRPLALDPIYRGAGLHVFVHHRSVTEMVGPLSENTPTCVLLVYWPKEKNSWLEVLISSEAQGKTSEFDATAPELVRLLQLAGVPAPQVNKGLTDFQQSFHFRVAEVSGTAMLHFEFRVNADDADFREETSGETPSVVLRELQCRVYPVSQAPRNAAASGIPLPPLQVKMTVDEMPYFDGAVALDFGNTSSALVCIESRSLDVHEIEVVDVDPNGSGGDLSLDDLDHTVPSAVRLFRFEPAEAAEQMPSAEWCVGRVARIRPGGDLILGAKRLMADPRQSELRKVFLDQGTCDIPKHLAAELFVSSLFQGLYSRKRKRARRIALTYPATFSQQEIGRLKQAVFQGITRSLLAPAYIKPDGLLERLIPVMLDEASAAAFFFIYRDFLRGPGRTNVFRYLYPEGINVLLYDCGGGTTDIALVHARPKRIQADGQEPWEVDVRVLGRTGHRGFGGDNITAAVARVLKAEIACHLSGQVQKKLDFPKVAAGFPRFLEDNKNLIDYLVPTKFKDLLSAGAVHDIAEFRLRREATLELWNWAESVKVWLGRDPADRRPVPRLPQDSKLVALIAKHHTVKADEFLTKIVNGELLKTLGDRRPFVDELIRDSIQRTIEATNRMIELRLTKPTCSRLGDRRPTPQGGVSEFNPEDLQDGSAPVPDRSAAGYPLPRHSCVHWVYVVGKASRYPLVRTMLQEGLQVGYMNTAESQATSRGTPGDSNDGGLAPSSSATPPDDGPPPDDRLRFDERTVKTSVACGAALALRMRFRQSEITVNWDSDLAGRLPYTISHDGFGRGWRDLFLEHERYQDLKPQSIAVSRRADGPQREGITVMLHRKWPDGTTEKYLDFAFEKPLEGPLWVRYDQDDQCFKMRDEKTEEEVIGVEIGQDIYVSPAQSGEL